MPARRVMPRYSRSMSRSGAGVEEFLVLLADLLKDRPIVAAEEPVVGDAFREGLTGDLLVNRGHAVVKLAFLVEPKAADLLEFAQGDQFQVLHVRGPRRRACILRLQDATEPVLAPCLRTARG